MEIQKLAYSPQEVSSLCGLSLNNVYLFLKQGKIPHIKLGRRYLVSASELEKWLAGSGNTK